MAMKLYVGGLAYETTEEQLKEMFGEHGEVTSTNIIMDRDTNRSKGFGFVEMSDNKDAQSAIASLNGKDVAGRKLTVNQARPQNDRGSGNNSRRSF